MSKYRQNRPQSKPLSVTERLLKEKHKALKKTIEKYIQRERELYDRQNEVLNQLGDAANLLPSPISTRAWLLNDGAVLVQYWDWRGKAQFDSVISPQTVAEWLRTDLSVPIEAGNLRLAGIASGSVQMIDCLVNDHLVRYFKSMVLRYDDPKLTDPEQFAVLDFRLTSMGNIMSIIKPKAQSQATPDKILERLEALLTEFESLLGSANKEEELQVFLKTNPLLLGPASNIIPKHKLGEDFVTDFIIVNMDSQGSHFTLVEIEKCDKRLFNGNGDISADLSHAEKQTIDWEGWLETNKAYLQNKLHGFETPEFSIIMGRSNGLTESDKKTLRIKNRRSKNLKIYTYDDILAQNKELLMSLRPLASHGA